MSTSVIDNSSSLNADQPDAKYPAASESILTAFTYKQLIEFHLERRGIDKDGNERPKQSLDNEESIIRDWLSHQKLSLPDIVGEELGIRFKESLSDYLSELEARELAEQTVKDRKSIIKKLRENFLALQRTSGLSGDFSGALKLVINTDDTSARQLSHKTGIPYKTLRNWRNGTHLPASNSLTQVRKLERVLNLPPGVLSSRLPDAHWSKGSVRRCTTSWRSRLSKLLPLKYSLRELPDSLKEEFEELVSFYTDPQWAGERGLKNNSEWRIRWNSNRCITAEINLKFIRRFFGYLCLPMTALDKRMAGLGFSTQNLTLALLTDSSIVLNYLRFMKNRSGAFNSATISFLNLCTMLTRKETGYLCQRLEFGAKLPRSVPAHEWSLWCEENRTKMLEFKIEISGGKNCKNGKKDYVRVTRDSFEPVIDIIRERQHPASALFDLSSRLESLTPLLERGSKVLLAGHCRSIFQVKLVSSNPLRSENFSMMTYSPQDHVSFDQACERYRRYRNEKRIPNFSDLYVETSGDSNLYQRRDGSWRLRFDERDFKNEKGINFERGIRPEPYDVEVVPSVWPALIDYLFRHRSILSEALRDAIQQVRSKRRLPALTPEEEQAIVRCPYVFRPGPRGAIAIGAERSSAEYGTSQLSAKTLSYQILSLTSRYLPESKGFCAHACRHLVATEYIKNHPDGWEVAAVALHNTAATVRKHYSWVEVGDLIKPWNNYYEDIKAKYDRGEL